MRRESGESEFETDDRSPAAEEKRGKIRAKRLMLVVFAVVLCLLLGEGYCRLQGVRPFPRVTDRTRFWQYDPDLGWKQRSGQSDEFELAEFRTRVTINGKGLRDGEHGYERTGEGERMLVLGDSFAWGFGVDRPKRFTELLEWSTGLEAINAGVPGYSTDQELLWYRTEGVKYDVDHVVLVFCGNDEAHNHWDRVYYVYGKPRFTLEGGKPVLENVPVPRPPAMVRFAHWLRCRSALFHALSRERPRAGVGWRDGAAAEFPLTMALLREMRELAEANGASFTILVAARRWWTSPSGAPIEEFIRTLHRDAFPVLDVEALPGFDPDRMIMPGNGHWNDAGHEFVARQLQRMLE